MSTASRTGIAFTESEHHAIAINIGFCAVVTLFTTAFMSDYSDRDISRAYEATLAA